MPCATPTTCANSWSRSRRTGRTGCSACCAAPATRERDRPLKPALVDLFRRHYDAVVAEGSAFHDALPPLAPATTKGGKPRRGRPPRRTGHNLLRRLETRKDDVLRFLVDPAVPFTNNEAERDGRPLADDALE